MHIKYKVLSKADIRKGIPHPFVAGTYRNARRALKAADGHPAWVIKAVPEDALLFKSPVIRQLHDSNNLWGYVRSRHDYEMHVCRAQFLIYMEAIMRDVGGVFEDFQDFLPGSYPRHGFRPLKTPQNFHGDLDLRNLML